MFPWHLDDAGEPGNGQLPDLTHGSAFRFRFAEAVFPPTTGQLAAALAPRRAEAYGIGFTALNRPDQFGLAQATPADPRRGSALPDLIEFHDRLLVLRNPSPLPRP